MGTAVRQCLLLSGLAFLVSVGVAPAWSASNLLDRPASASGRATSAVLLAVARSGKHLIAVGEQGIILVSTDDGARWQQAAVPSSVALTNVRFDPSGRAWAVGHGGLVLSSDDGGKMWVKRFDGLQAAKAELAAARAAVARTDNAAAQRRVVEAQRLAAEGADKPFFDIRFSDEKNGLLVGAYGLVFATRDGGRTWESLKDRIDNQRGRHLYAIEAMDDEVYLVGEQGALYRSADGGRHFGSMQSPYAGTFFGALATPGGGLIAFGLRGHAYATDDRGASWRRIDSEQAAAFTAGTRLADGSLLLANESGRLLRSVDNGRRFQPLAVPQPVSITGVIQAADGGLILTSARGVRRLPADTLIKRSRN